MVLKEYDDQYRSKNSALLATALHRKTKGIKHIPQLNQP
jgi:hypothetical protein